MIRPSDVSGMAERYKDVFCASCMERMVELARPVEARLSRGLPPWPWDVRKLTLFHQRGLCRECFARVVARSREK